LVIGDGELLIRDQFTETAMPDMCRLAASHY
jgi:hypothetical protein